LAKRRRLTGEHRYASCRQELLPSGRRGAVTGTHDLRALR
jgi:hypothetical protein